jgi:methionyl-tRNA formyltransferase
VKEDGVLDFAEPATVLAARINGLLPWPGCTVPINGQSVKLGLAEALPANLDLNLIHPDTPEPGVVVGADAGGLLVGTGRGVLRLRKLQRPGGRMLPATEFLRGFPVEPGVRLPSRPMPPLVAREPFPRVRG